MTVINSNTRAPILDEMYKMGERLLRKEFDNVEIEYNFMDLFGFSLGGDSCEIEIKCNDYDFYKEFNNPIKKSKT